MSESESESESDSESEKESESESESAACPTPATQKQRGQRNARGMPGRTSDPLAVEIAPCLPRKSGGAQGTPEAYIRPLGRGDCPTPATQKQRGPRNVSPWQWRLSHACHAKAAEPKERQRDARAYNRPLGSGDYPTPATQKRRSPRNNYAATTAATATTSALR